MSSPVIRSEMILFFLAVLHGILLELWYAVLRGLRRAVPHAGAVVSVEDFFYWLAAGFVTFLLLFSVSDGVLRGYAVIAMALGALLGHVTVSPVVQRAVECFFCFICFLVRRFLLMKDKILCKVQKRIENKRKRRYNKADRVCCEKKTAGQRGIRNGRKKKNRQKKDEQK